jgi:hypothetical protein
MGGKLSGPPPLAERFWFVAERGVAGWVKSVREPVLWCLRDESGLWRLSDIREVSSDDWVLPFCQFKLIKCFRSGDGTGDQALFTRGLARFPPTPRKDAPPLVPAVPPRVPTNEQLGIPF